MADLVSTLEAASFLRLSSGDDLATLAEMVTAASDMIARRIGPVATATAYSEWYDGGYPTIVLRHTPVQSITKITEAWGFSQIFTLNASVLDGTTTDLSYYGYSLDPTIGLITRRAAGSTLPFAGGSQNVNVQYTAGFATVPAELKLATKLLVMHMFDTQRGGSKRPGLGGEDASQSSSTYDMFPSRVEQILENFYTPGIA